MLCWKMKTLNYNARFIQLAGEINSDMPRYWVAKALRPGSGQRPSTFFGALLAVAGFVLRLAKGLLTEPPCGLRIADCGLRIADCGLGIADWGLGIGDCGLGIADGSTALTTGCGIRDPKFQTRHSRM